MDGGGLPEMNLASHQPILPEARNSCPGLTNEEVGGTWRPKKVDETEIPPSRLHFPSFDGVRRRTVTPITPSPLLLAGVGA